jgi:hypothetical protein
LTSCSCREEIYDGESKEWMQGLEIRNLGQKESFLETSLELEKKRS